MNEKRQYIRKNLALAWPLALNALLMQSMVMIDTLLVSPLGEDSIKVMGIAATIVTFILGIQMALANGTQMITSRAFGSGREKSLGNAFWSGLLIAFVFAIIFWIFIKLFGDDIAARLIGPSIPMREMVQSYLDISVYLILFTALTQTIITLFNSVGKTSIPFKGYLIELPVNCALSYYFIYSLDMGVQGAALGSLCALILRSIYLTYCVYADTSIRLPLPETLTAFGKTVRNHLFEILPFAANMTILALGITAYQSMYTQLNVNEYVVLTLLFPWLRIGTLIIVSWAHSSAILVSQQIGSGKLDKLEGSVNTSIDIAVVASLISCLFFVGFYFSFELLYPSLAPETYAAMTLIAPLYIFLPLVRGYNTIHGNILRAVGKTTSVFKINFIGQWVVSLPLLAVIIFVFDGSIFWAFAIQPLEEIIKALPFRMLARKTVKEFSAEQAEKLNYE